MSELIAQHQQALLTAPVQGGDLDADVVRANDNALKTTLNAHDADAGIHVQSSVAASRPSFGVAGRKWFTTDTLRLYYDTGSAWTELAYLPLAGGTLTGGIVTSGSLTSLAGAVTVKLLADSGNAWATIGTYSAHNLKFISNSITRGQLTSAGVFELDSITATSLTVTAGTTAVQALTATTLGLSGLLSGASAAFSSTLTSAGQTITGSPGISVVVTSSATGFNRGSIGTSTNHDFWIGANNDLFWGVEASSGNLVARVDAVVDIGNSGAKRFRNLNMSGTGTFGGALTVTGNSTITGTLSGITTLTATTIAGNVNFTGTPTFAAGLAISAASGKIIAGATSLLIRNNADSATNLLISDAGNITARAGSLTTLVDLTTTGTVTMANFPFCALSADGGQVVAVNGAVLSTLEDVDASGMHSTSSNTGRITIPAGMGGTYAFQGRLKCTAGAFFQWRLNGTTAFGSSALTAGTEVSVFAIRTLAAGDYVELCNISGGSVTLNSNGAGSDGAMMAYRVT